MPGRETDDSHATRLPTPRGAQAPSPQPPFPRWVFSDAISSRGTGDGGGGGTAHGRPTLFGRSRAQFVFPSRRLKLVP